MKNSIEVHDLVFKYEEKQDNNTVDHVSFTVKQGEWLSIVGHNGSGKSTIVRLLDGLLEAKSGQILIEGQELNLDNVWDIRQKIGMVFQNPDNQFVGATVEDDIAFGLENKGMPFSEMKKKVDHVLDLVGMTAYKDREPSRLSGGQKQRVAIAGAIALEPHIIILDEATSMLDPKGRLQLIQTIQEIRQKYQLTVISITHDLDEIALSERVLVMKQGKIVSDVTPKELFQQKELLDEFGLDTPFTTLVKESLESLGYPVGQDYLTEKELEDLAWALISKK